MNAPPRQPHSHGSCCSGSHASASGKPTHDDRTLHTRHQSRGRSAHGHNVHMPQASGNSPARAGKLPDLRHGPGAFAANRHSQDNRELVAVRRQILDLSWPRPAGPDHCNAFGRDFGLSDPLERLRVARDRAAPVSTGRTVGRRRLLQTRLARTSVALAEHVHPHRDGSCRSLFIQSDCNNLAPPRLPGRNEELEHGLIDVYFEAAAVIVLPGPVG